MRFGLMFMYPVDGVSTSGSQNFQMSQLPTDKTANDAQKDVTITKSVFSTLDTNQNNKVNYSEANSIFANAQKSLENGDGQRTLDSAVTDATAKTNIKSSVLSKFNATEKFNSLISKFSVDLGKQTVSASTEGEATNAATKVTAELDREVRTAAQALIDSANQQLNQMYNEAMMSAITDYNNGKDLEINKDQNANAEALRGTGDGTTSEIETKTNTGETKFEATVYSKFDSVSADGSVRAADGEINIASVQDIVGNKLSALGGDSQLASAIKTDIFSAYSAAKQEYSIDVGSKDVKGKNQTELNKKMDEAISKLDAKVQSKKADADKKLEKAINKAYDSAYKANLGTDLSGKQMLIQTNIDGQNVTLVPGQNGQYTVSGINGKFTPSGDGGGTIETKVAASGDEPAKTVTYTIDSKGTVTSTTTKTEPKPAENEGETISTTTTTTPESETTTTERAGGSRGKRSLTLTTSGDNTSVAGNDPSVSGFTFTPTVKDGSGEAPSSVNVEMQDGKPVVTDGDGNAIEGASVTESNGKYTVKVGDKTYTVEIDTTKKDVSATEEEPAPSVHKEEPVTVTAQNGRKGLSGIASNYVDADGKPANWKDLANANPQIKQPNYIIKVGDKLEIPDGWKKKQ